MPTYFDPITYGELDIDDSTVLYLVEVMKDIEHPQLNTYSIKGISSGLNQLPSDPHARATQYWLIDNTATFLLANQTDEKRKSLFFPENQLTPYPLSTADVKTYLGFDPEHVEAIPFNPEIGEALRNDWVNHIVARAADDANVQQQTLRARLSSLRQEIENSQQRLIDLCAQVGIGLFTRDDIATMSSDKLDELSKAECLLAIRDGLFTIADINAMEHAWSIRVLIKPESLLGIREGLYTANDIARMSVRADGLTTLSRPECQQGIREGLFTPSDIIALQQSGGDLYILKPTCLQALRDRVFTINELTETANIGGWLPYLLYPQCLQAIKDKLFTVAELTKIPGGERLTKPECIQAMREGLFTLDDLASIDDWNMCEIMQPVHIQAMRDGKTTIAQLISLDVDVLTDAEQTGEYPSYQPQMHK